MSALRVAHVIASFGLGGQERVVIDLAAAQRRAGHQVCAVALSPEQRDDLSGALRAAGADIERVPKRPGFDPTLYPRLARLFRRRRLQLVHTHNPMPLIYAAPAARAARARVVHTKHGEHQDRWLRMALRRTGARFADAFVAVSPTTAEFARMHREYPEARIRIIRNGTDLGRFGPDEGARAAVRAELGIPEQAWVVGSIGRFVPEKDQALLLTAIEPLLGEEHHLVLAGDGPDLPAVRRAVESSRARAHVHLLGRRDDVPALLRALDVFAISSRTEGLPIVLIEAMASGLPIVSTAVGGIPGVLRDGDHGWLVPPADPEALRGALAQTSKMREEAARRGARGRELALSELSADRMHREYLSLYREVLPK